MGIRHSCNLGKVGNADNLMVSGYVSHLLRDHLGGPPADSCVNLIKNQGRNIIRIRKHCLDGQHDPGQFSAGSHILQRTHRKSRIGGDHKFRLVKTIGRILFQPGKFHLKLNIYKIQIFQALADLFCQNPGRLFPYIR